nr:tyrosine-type recombinase/integrase [uncultured Cupriavidus sp.]
MFDRFHRHLVSRGATLASFGPDLIEAFWLDPEAADYTPATRMRYLKLVERLCRHLVHIGVRASNPAAELVLAGRWPQDEPEPLYLSPAVDARLHDFVQPLRDDDPAQLRCRAIVAFFLGTGVTAVEGRMARLPDLHPNASPPYLHVPAKSPKIARTVHLEPFAVAPLSAWVDHRRNAPVYGNFLFTMLSAGTAITDMSLGNIVHEAFDLIGSDTENMSPRILRNTYCRRALLQGVPRNEITLRLGLSSNRTVDRMAKTIEA